MEKPTLLWPARFLSLIASNAHRLCPPGHIPVIKCITIYYSALHFFCYLSNPSVQTMGQDNSNSTGINSLWQHKIALVWKQLFDGSRPARMVHKYYALGLMKVYRFCSRLFFFFFHLHKTDWDITRRSSRSGKGQKDSNISWVFIKKRLTILSSPFCGSLQNIKEEIFCRNRRPSSLGCLESVLLSSDKESKDQTKKFKNNKS